MIKGKGEKFDLLCGLTNDPYENPEITRKLDESGIDGFKNADPHWLPGLFAVFCDEKEKAMRLVKKHDQRAFIDGSHVKDGILCISFRAGNQIADFWEEFCHTCGFEFIKSYIEENEDYDEDYDEEDEEEEEKMNITKQEFVKAVRDEVILMTGGVLEAEISSKISNNGIKAATLMIH